MGTRGPVSGLTFASDNSIGTIAISSPANALLSDDLYASSVLTLNQVTNYLKVTSFPLFIPLDATITGILVEVERSATAGSACKDNAIRVVKGGVIGSTDRSVAPFWPTTDAYQSYGGITDLWGTTWSPLDINSLTFGVAVSCIASGGAATARIDHVRITVYYEGSNRPGITRRLKAGSGMSVSENAS